MDSHIRLIVQQCFNFDVNRRPSLTRIIDILSVRGYGVDLLNALIFMSSMDFQ
jgi:hypothetical protein